MNLLKIIVQKPCRAKWNSMMPNDTGRFCITCHKSVVDFTNKSQAEILDYFKSYTVVKVCGHFNKAQLTKNDQMNTNLLKPGGTLLNNIKRLPVYLTAIILLAMTTILSSCNQTTTGEIIDNTDTIVDETLTGDSIYWDNVKPSLNKNGEDSTETLTGEVAN